MKVLYDISVLGVGHLVPRARTGIFRVVEHTANGLAQSGECDLSFYASQDNYLPCIEYLRSNPILAHYKIANLERLFPFFSKVIKNLPIKGRRYSLYDSLEINLNKICNKIGTSGFGSKMLQLDKNIAVDICHSPFYRIPETMQLKKVKKFQTIYDLIPILYPEFFEFEEDHLIKGVIDSLDHDTFILCISASTKNDLCNYSNKIDTDKVFVVPLAASEVFYQCTEPEILVAVRNRYGIPLHASYFLSVSTLEPRKNIDQAIRAFVRLLQEEKAEDLYLVLTGTKGWDYERIFSEITSSNDFKDKIILTGYVPDEDLAPLYSGALGFLYPSFYEGFGLPPLEAMQCGTPVIASNTSSLPEVVGDAGIQINPNDLDALCQAMFDLYGKVELREALSLHSLARARQFSWSKYTQGVIQAYKHSLD